MVTAGTELSGFVGAISAGYGPDRNAAARARIAQFSGLYRTVGLHPWWLAQHDPEDWPGAWRAVAAELAEPNVVAIGEIGLDQSRRKQVARAEQERQFQIGLELAATHNLPVVLHVVRWYGHALRVLQDRGAYCALDGGVLHGYGGPSELVPSFQRLGLHLSLSPGRWRRDPVAAMARVDAIDPAHLLVETDWPQGQGTWAEALVELRAFVVAIAAHRGRPAQDVAAQLHDNALRLYRL